MSSGNDHSSTFTSEQMPHSDFYIAPNNSKKKIKFIVFSNTEPDLSRDISFKKRLNEDNEDVDFVYLKETIIPKLGNDPDPKLALYDCYVFPNLGLSGEKGEKGENELWDELKKMEEDQDSKLELASYDCYVFVFLTFCSSKDCEMNIDFHKSSIPLEKIWEEVGKISAMTGKPKIFLVQADAVELLPEKPRKSKGPEPFDVIKIPTDADRLTIIGTIPGEGFVEGDKDPSFLIQAFVEVVKDNRDKTADNKMDLLSQTVNINEKVVRLMEESKQKKTKAYMDANQLKLPLVTSTFRKLLVLDL